MIKHLTRILLTALLAFYNTSLLAADIAGNVELAAGKVWIQGADNKMRAIKPDQPVFEGDIIITGADGELQVRMKDDGFIAVRPNSKLKIESYRAEGDADDKATFSLLLGTFRSVTGWIGKYNRDNYSINTRTATIGVRGTDHEPMYIPPAVPGMPPIGEPGVYDKVNSGRIVIKNAFGETEFDKGQAAFVGLNSRQAAVRLKGIPDFFKPSTNEQRIEDARTTLESGLDSNLLKRQQQKIDSGMKARPLLQPQSLPEKSLTPETKPAAPDEKNDIKLLPGARPTAPTRSDDRNAPVAPRMPGSTKPILSPDASTHITPISPAEIRTLPAPLPALTPKPALEAPVKLAPAITPQSVLQPQSITPISATKMEMPALSTTVPTPAPTLIKPTLQTISPTLQNTQLAPTPVITEQKQITVEEPAPISPVLLQAPTKLLLPAR
jgi:hypothetical protein